MTISSVSLSGTLLHVCTKKWWKEDTSNASEFHVILWKLNVDVTNDVTIKFTKEFTKAQREIYKLISKNPRVSIDKMSQEMRVSARQVKRYMKQLQELQKITRVGGNRNGEWKIIDEEYEGFFDRI